MRKAIFTAKRVAGRKDVMAQNERAIIAGGLAHHFADEPGFRVGARGRYRVGQNGGAAAGNCAGGTGRPNTCPPATGGGYLASQAGCPPKKCDCHVLGANSLGGAGIATTAFGQLTVNSGDASSFDPFYMMFFAYERNGNNDLANSNPIVVLLTDSRSGREPNLRQGSETNNAFGITSDAYGRDKEVQCNDWRAFSSTGQQQLFLTFNNPTLVTEHVFVVLWGIPYA